MTTTPTAHANASNDFDHDGLPHRLAYSIPEASLAIGIGKTKLYSLIASGVLPSTLIGTRRLIRRIDLEALISGELRQAA
jgi:excisionase family DNA binding protein